MKRRILALVCSAAALFLAAALHNAHAVPPGIFYRVVGAAPNVVFPRGFLPRGTNRNLLTHEQGLSCNNGHTEPGSAYTSFTDNEARTHVIARERLDQQRDRGIQDPSVWVYTVRGTQDFYNVADTFNAVDAEIPGLARATQAANVAAEWVANVPVRGDQILSARQLRMRDGQLYYYGIQEVTVNPAYVALTPTFNPNPLPANVVGRQGNLLQHGIHVAGNFMSSCWCASGAGAISRRLLATPRSVLDEDSDKICEEASRLFNPEETQR
jgi:hypothetical protein